MAFQFCSVRKKSHNPLHLGRTNPQTTMCYFQHITAGPEQSKGKVSDETVWQFLAREAEAAKRTPGKTRTSNPPNWMRSECIVGAKNGIGASVKSRYELKTLRVQNGIIVMMATTP